MVVLDCINIFLYKRMIKENRSQGNGEKRGEINLTLNIGYFYLGLHHMVYIALIRLATPGSRK
jgi:hypothetical protein